MSDKFGDNAITDPSRRYERLHEYIGAGAYKRVFRAYDNQTGLEVAWNQVYLNKSSQYDASKILEEIRILQSLMNDNIINIKDSWLAKDENGDKTLFFITELMTSGTLSSYIRRPKLPTSVNVLKRWSYKILSGLNYLHSRDPPIIHRDLKCENVFINGSNGKLKIGDLGIAVAKTNRYLTTVIGTPEFMAPELYDESYDEKADIYAFGMVVLELFTRKRPYSECENSAQIYKKVLNGIPPRSILELKDEEVRNFIMICINPIADERPPASELLKHEFFKIEEDKKPKTSHNNTLDLQLCHRYEVVSNPPLKTAVSCNESSTQIGTTTHVRNPSQTTEDSLGKKHPVVYTEFSISSNESDSKSSLNVIISCYNNGAFGKDIKFLYNINVDTPELLVAELIQEKLISPENDSSLVVCLSEFMSKITTSPKADGVSDIILRTSPGSSTDLVPGMLTSSNNSKAITITLQNQRNSEDVSISNTEFQSRTIHRSELDSSPSAGPACSFGDLMTSDTCVEPTLYPTSDKKCSHCDQYPTKDYSIHSNTLDIPSSISPGSIPPAECYICQKSNSFPALIPTKSYSSSALSASGLTHPPPLVSSSLCEIHHPADCSSISKKTRKYFNFRLKGKIPPRWQPIWGTKLSRLKIFPS